MEQPYHHPEFAGPTSAESHAQHLAHVRRQVRAAVCLINGVQDWELAEFTPAERQEIAGALHLMADRVSGART